MGTTDVLDEEAIVEAVEETATEDEKTLAPEAVAESTRSPIDALDGGTADAEGEDAQQVSEPPAYDYEAERAKKLAYRASLTEEDIARIRKREKPANYAFGRKVAEGVEGASLSGDPDERERTALEIERDQRIEQAARVDNWQAKLDAMSSDERVQATLDCLGRRPSFARVLRAVLEYCREERNSDDVEAYIETLPDFAANRQSARRYVVFLIRTGALAEVGYDAEGNPVDERTVQAVQDELHPTPAPDPDADVDENPVEADEACNGEAAAQGTVEACEFGDAVAAEGIAVDAEAAAKNPVEACEVADAVVAGKEAAEARDACGEGALEGAEVACARGGEAGESTVACDEGPAETGETSDPEAGDPEGFSAAGAEAPTTPVDPEDLIVEWRLSTTAEGLQALEATDARGQLRTLLAEQAEHRYAAYLDVLTFCEEPRTLAQISEFLIGNPGLEIDDRGIVNMQPNAYIGKLDKAGALVWTGQGWKTTKEALQVLEEC